MTGVVIPGLEHPEMITQVQAGMQLLDRDRPSDWPDSVYLPDLDINSGCSCVIGQVYREVYDTGFVGAVLHLLNIVWSRVPSDADYQLLVDHGFAVSLDYYSEGEAAKLQLEAVWKVLLQQRSASHA